MPVTRLEICNEHLSVDQREALLDAVWEHLRISPGMVTADGNVELALSQCGAGVNAEDAPLVRVGGQDYSNVTPQKLVSLLRRWTR
ncbi:NAD(P)H-dependent oxidoreductase subunit E [Deinococcus frigens]|uniref:NAD(P)H-dependent oxidoreductase subunit E n=1 Tax=Deinococcus frigens TaxID=249403 RepID=UPI0004976D26|nr:NAD(P)H-dependent oxidoreductase subunit E [Deinococcus frigens]